MSGAWGYSQSGETYHCGFDSREDAIEEARECCDGDFFVAEGMQPHPGDFVPDADDIIETMQERAADSEGGEWTEDWLEGDGKPSKEARDELEAFLKTWAAKHCPVTWWLFGMTGEPERIEHEPDEG